MHALALVATLLAGAQPSPVRYVVSFAEPHHGMADVQATFSGAPRSLELIMSRSSPGRYAIHDFVRGVMNLSVRDGKGRALTPQRVKPHRWVVTGHDGTVHVSYRLYGTRLDGTNTAIDASHAHLSMPATFLWAKGLEQRPVEVRFQPPAGSGWKVATQLYPTSDSYKYTAPNLTYFMDSPTELSDFGVRSFKVRNPDGKELEIRAAVHHDGPESALDEYIAMTEKICREQAAIFGEYPDFETGRYTFIGDYVPWGGGAGMEHRNSTVVAAPFSFTSPRAVAQAMGTVSHEFFHAWNVERIRPRSLEPFDLEDANLSGELWIGEGFTQYYGMLTMGRAGLEPKDEVMVDLVRQALDVLNHPARGVRSPVEMSQMATFIDGAGSTAGTNLDTTVISYYTYGAALAFALDLELRSRSGSKVSLDDLMRDLWVRFGRAQGAPGHVPKPYTLPDVQASLARVSGDARFAKDFFDRYVYGTEMPDFDRLFALIGVALSPLTPGPWAGVSVDDGGRVTRTVSPSSPAWKAGLQRGDVIVSVNGQPFAGLAKALEGRAPGDVLQLEIRRRSGRVDRGTLRLTNDPSRKMTVTESFGAETSDAVRAFRTAWMASRVK